MLKVMRQWPERRNLLRQKSRAALAEEKVQAVAIFISARTKAQIRKTQEINETVPLTPLSQELETVQEKRKNSRKTQNILAK